MTLPKRLYYRDGLQRCGQERGEPTRDVEASKGFQQSGAVTTSGPDMAEGENGTTEAPGK